MYVCLCYGITDSDVRQAIANGAASLADLSAATGLATNCGSCAELANELLTLELAPRRTIPSFPIPLVAAA